MTTSDGASWTGNGSAPDRGCPEVQRSAPFRRDLRWWVWGSFASRRGCVVSWGDFSVGLREQLEESWVWVEKGAKPLNSTGADPLGAYVYLEDWGGGRATKTVLCLTRGPGECFGRGGGACRGAKWRAREIREDVESGSPASSSSCSCSPRFLSPRHATQLPTSAPL